MWSSVWPGVSSTRASRLPTFTMSPWLARTSTKGIFAVLSCGATTRQLYFCFSSAIPPTYVGGIAELKQKYNCRVVAPHDKTAKIPLVDVRASQGDIVKVGNLLARVLETPGHTLDHITYVFDDDKALFAADTLFSIGCGRVFEGNYPMMWESLLKLRALPDDFKLYCGHEYTAANVKFALTIEPNNPDLKARAEEVAKLRAQNKATIPVKLGEEKNSNVLLRADDPAVAAALHMKGAAAADVFGELRERKNKS